jgi:exonuclease III
LGLPCPWRRRQDAPKNRDDDLSTGAQHVDRSASGTCFSLAERFDELSSKSGLVDLWRRSNGSDTREWTWISNGRNGFRIDHAFGNEAFIRLAEPSCFYDHRVRKENITDHSALIVDCSADEE